ncbi:MAG TPA: hypothetical protein VFY45_06635 [Baekduia sp.]|nr:hypothetical protein [Baekduia sp.]
MKRRSRKPEDERPIRLTGAFGRLEDTFREAGAKQDQERKLQEQRLGAKRSTREGLGRRALGPVVGTVAAFCVAGAGVAISTDIFSADHGSVSSGPKPPDETRHAPGDAYRGNALAADPLRPALHWGVGVYPSQNGRDTCLLAGRVRGKGLGVEQDGRFTSLNKDAPGLCDDIDARHAIFTTRTYFNATGGRTLLYGLVDRTVTSLRLGPPGALKELDVASDGTFIVVALGTNALRDQQFEITGATGAERYTLQPGH